MLAAVGASMLVAGVGIPASSASPTQECGILNPCESTSTSVDPGPEVTTTSVTDESSTTVGEETTTTEAVQATTSTTRKSSASTVEEVVATSTTLSVTTSSNVLVPGDGTQGAESTTTTLEQVAKVSDGGLSDGTLITLVIAGLVLIALVVSVLTWRYWVATRPPLRDPVDADPAPAR